MSYLIAAAGTGGHVFPGLAVGEALVGFGIDRDQVLFVGGDRLESEVYPSAGFPFLQLEIGGLKREWALSNLRLPRIFAEASKLIGSSIIDRQVRIILGMGGYITVPAAIASRRRRVPLFIAEQNASAGLANRFASRFARRVFGSFPKTDGLPRAQWTGNPIRESLRLFDRDRLRPAARVHYGLDEKVKVVGVIGGSLGAGALNKAAALLAASSPDYSILNLSGKGQLDQQSARAAASSTTWVVRDFEPRIEFFYAAVDVVVARAGGAVAELTATATPSVLVPGGFGSSGHQVANAQALVASGAALSIDEDSFDRLPAMVSSMIAVENHAQMTQAARSLARPNAAIEIAAAMRTVHESVS